MKVKGVFPFVLLAILVMCIGSANGEIVLKKAKWNAEKQRLEVKVKADDEYDHVSVLYNNINYLMKHKEKKKDYELKIGPVCYADEAVIQTSDGMTYVFPVAIKEGSAKGYECQDGGTDPSGGAGSDIEIKILKAQWQAGEQKLELKVSAPGSSGQLTALYNGKSYTLRQKEREKYELKIKPICYSDQLLLQDANGNSYDVDVALKGGSAEGHECGSITPPPACHDLDGDGFVDVSCGGTDCSDNDSSVHPGAPEICGDNIDQDCSGSDLPCGSGVHADLLYKDYPANCISCHQEEAGRVHASTHYQWLGEAPDMVNGAGQKQGKLTNAVNSYCVNILGDWPVCGTCHIGRGLRPDDTADGLANIDCLVCHNAEYAASRIRLADGTMGVPNPTDQMVRNIQLPARANCLGCHAKAGGGDGVKRGDLSLALSTNSDPAFDIHMNVNGPDLKCQSCHEFQNHKVIGKGSDLRPTDDPARGSEIRCARCHEGKNGPSGHKDSKINDHVARVACQTCHIPVYAKFPTETFRDWRRHHDGSPADNLSAPGHPYTEKAANLIPRYRWWNRLSNNYLLGDDASNFYNPETQTYSTSMPVGGISDDNSMIYPFKYKTAVQPKTVSDNKLIALDTFEYLKVSGDADKAVAKGLLNMGYPSDEPYEWVTTDTYQLLNHGVSPAGNALSCEDCHGSSGRIDLKGELGYTLKGPMRTNNKSGVCEQCHGYKSPKPFFTMHEKHVRSKRYDCSWCHNFTRPERGLRRP